MKSYSSASLTTERTVNLSQKDRIVEIYFSLSRQGLASDAVVLPSNFEIT